MTDDRLNILRCPSKGGKCRRPLAWLEVDAGGSVVVANLVTGGRKVATLDQHRFPAEYLHGRLDEDQEPHEVFMAPAMCDACGSRYPVDFMAVLEGRDQILVKDTTDYRDLGVSFDQ